MPDGPPGPDAANGDGYGAPSHRRAREPRVRRPPAALEDAPRLPHVPGFEGIRALALVAILVFHQGYDFVRGGFLGISSFFTLSGFLVATLALAEWAQTGHLAVGRFWERRARRILPAGLALLAGVVVLQTVLRVGAHQGFRTEVLAALGWVTNWQIVGSGEDVAGIFIDPSPVQHLWSVSMLVQLTVVLPLLFVGLMSLTRRHWRLTGALFALAAAGSFALAHSTAAADGNGGLAYYGTQNRAGELLVGVVLAYAVLSPAVRRVLETEAGITAVRYGALAALAGLAWLWHSSSLGDTRLFGGVTVLNAVLTAWVVLAVTTPGPATSFLTATPLRLLGRISYAAYLVHWPVYLLIDEPRLDLDRNLLFLLRIAVTLVVAVLLHVAVEQPLRRLRLSRPALTGLLAASTAVVAAAVMVLPVQPPLNVSLDIDDGSGPGDLDVVAPQGGTEAATVALVGDELAAALPAGFGAWNGEHTDQQARVHTHVAETCPPGAAGPVRFDGRTIGEGTACTGWEPRLPQLLDEGQPDAIVVVTGLGELGEREVDREWRHLGEPAYDDWLRTELDGLADTLAEPGVPVLWATYPHVRVPGAGEDWTQVEENDPRRVDRLNELIHDVAGDREGFQVIDLTAWAQDLPRGGEFSPDYREGGVTLTEAGSQQAVAWLMPQVLDAAGG